MLHDEATCTPTTARASSGICRAVTTDALTAFTICLVWCAIPVTWIHEARRRLADLVLGHSVCARSALPLAGGVGYAIGVRRGRPECFGQAMSHSSASCRSIRLLSISLGEPQGFFGVNPGVFFGFPLPARPAVGDDPLLPPGEHSAEPSAAGLLNAIIAVGMTLVIITAGIDLSVGSVLGFVRHDHHVRWWRRRSWAGSGTARRAGCVEVGLAGGTLVGFFGSAAVAWRGSALPVGTGAGPADGPDRDDLIRRSSPSSAWATSARSRCRRSSRSSSSI